MRRLLITLAMSSLLAGSAAAQSISGLYIGLGVGFNQRADFDASFSANAGSWTLPPMRRGGSPPVVRSSALNGGYASNIAIGWGFGNGLRAEVEGSYRFNQGVTGTSTQGAYFRQYGLMANALYDIRQARLTLPGGLSVQPSIGIGAGYVWSGVDVPGGGAGWNLRGRFAYQGIVGLTWSSDALPRAVSIATEYRYTGMLATRLERPSGSSVRFAGENHSVMLGVRYAFGVSEPAPATPATVGFITDIVRTYMVFFDLNSIALTDRARRIVAEAATAARSARSTRIELFAHTDTTGSAQYNQALSRRRGEAVLGELMRNNVRREHIVMTAFGETRGLVPTTDNVNQQDNRRVEIVIR